MTLFIRASICVFDTTKRNIFLKRRTAQQSNDDRFVALLVGNSSI